MVTTSPPVTGTLGVIRLSGEVRHEVDISTIAELGGKGQQGSSCHLIVSIGIEKEKICFAVHHHYRELALDIDAVTFQIAGLTLRLERSGSG